MLEKPHGWQKTAIALGAAAAFGLGTLPAHALTLGPTVILSQQGEPLRAAIELPQISAEEAASLQAGLAPAEVFRASGLNYSAGLEGLQITLQKGDGRAYLQLRGKAPLQQAFVDLLVEIQWSSGRILRAYTLLLEAPPQPVTVTPPAPAPAASAESPAAPAATTPPAAAPMPAPAMPAPAPSGARRTVVVKYGDTAGAIVSAHALANATHEQMLLALLQGNPQAFVNNNVNRLRSGVELTLPDSAQALATPAPEARRIIQAQYREFNDYRRQLAEGAARAKVQAAKRKDKGSIEALPEPSKDTAKPADKLTLSKGAQGKTAEDELSKRSNQKETDERAAELEKNLAELRKLSAELSQQASAPAAAASEPASSPLPAMAAAVAVQPASTPEPAASEPASAPPAAATLPVAPAANSSPLLDTLLDNPLLPALASSLLALLAALGLSRIRQRRAGQESKGLTEEVAETPAFIPPQPPEPALAPTPASVTPAPQPQAAPEPEPEPETPREVDPVAEADVYLAYGREEQAVAVLREGLINHPDRLAIHMKLLEIYAKQLNTQPFEEIALQVQQLTGGEGEDWDRACEMGQTIDPFNALYQPPGEAAPAEEPAPTGDDDWAAALAEASAPPAPPEPERSELDLDLSQAVAPAEPPAPPAEELGSDLELDSPPEEAPAEPPAPIIEEPPRPAQAASAPLDFDLGSINLDLGTSQEPPPPPSEDPLAVKLALAEEFTAIGDTDGARSLLEEVIAESSGDVRAKAEAALQKLQ